MSVPVTIAVDAMGGDEGPDIVVSALKLFLSQQTLDEDGTRILLVGVEDELSAILKAQKLSADLTSKIRIVDAPDVVSMSDRPAQALRSKPDSSMAVALSLVASGEADACVSAGNTGALMAFSRAYLKMHPGVVRPAITTLLPGKSGGSFVLDLGANVDATAENLVQFAWMGHSLAAAIKRCDEPSVALLNVGSEAQKGTMQVRLADSLLREQYELNYVGFIEGQDIFNGCADVIVCDGFAGNVALKSAEGLAQLIIDELTAYFSRGWHRRFLGWLVSPFMRRLKKSFDSEAQNGAVFLGLQGLVIKSHGNASHKSFASALQLAEQSVRADLVPEINKRLDQVLV